MLLAGTALSWFFLDVAYYGLSLNNATILQAIGYSTTGAKNTYEILYNTAVGNLIIVLAGAVPGYWFTVATVDTVGRKPIQLAGFAILTVLFIIMGVSRRFFPVCDLELLLISGTVRLRKARREGLIGSLCAGPILLQLRPQFHDIHRPRRMLPHPLSVHLARYLRRFWKNRFHHRPGSHRAAPDPRCYCGQRLAMAQPRAGNFLALHALRLLLDSAHQGDQAEDTRGALRRRRLRGVGRQLIC